MRPTPRILVLGTAAAGAVLVLAHDGPTQAANTSAVQVVNTPLPVTQQADGLTHLRRRASDHVTLRTWSTVPGSTSATFRNYGDPADTGDDPLGYRIPAGKVLVVTDVVWAGTTANATHRFELQALERVGNNLASTALYEAPAAASDDGTIFDRFSIQSGVIVRSGTYPVVNLPPVGHALLLGYFADDL